MTIKKSPGAVEAAHGAFKTDELGWRVSSENSLFPQLAQAPQHRGESMRSCDRHEPPLPKQQDWLRDIRVKAERAFSSAHLGDGHKTGEGGA